VLQTVAKNMVNSISDPVEKQTKIKTSV
jgi:hypothetical protein